MRRFAAIIIVLFMGFIGIQVVVPVIADVNSQTQSDVDLSNLPLTDGFLDLAALVVAVIIMAVVTFTIFRRRT